MTGFNLQISALGSDYYTICAIAQCSQICGSVKESFLKNGPIPASFCLLSFFSRYNFNTN